MRDLAILADKYIVEALLKDLQVPLFCFYGISDSLVLYREIYFAQRHPNV